MGVQRALKKLVGGAVRRSTGVGGSWSMIDDAGHKPIGVASVTQPDAFSYKINYPANHATVGTILSVVDMELSPYGIHTGASAAVDGATFNQYAPCVLYVNGRGSVTASPLWTSQTGSITTPDAATVTITHANRALAVDPPGVTPVVPAAGSFHRPFYVSWTATTTTITSLDEIQGLCVSNGTTFTLSDCPNLNVSIAWGSGALTITHPDVTGHNNVSVTPLNSTLKPEIASISGTTMVVQFRDTTGALVGPAQTNQMKFYFRRAAWVPSTMDTGVRYAVDLGLCKVANDDVGNISLNNFWVIGLGN